MKEIIQQTLSGERALYGTQDARISFCTFADGESPLKESSNLEIDNCLFKWKYPLWYTKNVTMTNSTLFDMARAGIWYVDNISVSDTVIEATLWNCQDIDMEQVTARGDYFAMNCKNVRAKDFTLVGNYSFDGGENIEICHSRMLSKDAFWNAENVTVYDSFISGEYLGWNSRNITLINCTIESLQGMCYIDNLVMKNCRLINTNLAFEYSQADVEIIGEVDSVFNPKGGIIRADHIGELIMDGRRVKIDQTKIEAETIDKKSDRAEWERDRKED